MSAVMVVTFFNGLNIAAWTSWVFFALGIEIVIIWAYTVSTHASVVTRTANLTDDPDRLSTPSSHLVGLSPPSSATITISSHLHTIGSECSWLFPFHSYRASPPKHTNSISSQATSTPCGTSTSSNQNATSGRTDREAGSHTFVGHKAHDQAHGRNVFVHSVGQNSSGAERICQRVFGRRFTEGSTSIWKKTALHLDVCRATYPNDTPHPRKVQNDENATPLLLSLPSVCLSQYDGRSLQHLHLYIYLTKRHLPPLHIS